MSESDSFETIHPPGARKLAMELRAPLEMLATFALWPLLTLNPRGDGHPVLVLPGLAASDRSTEILRRFLKAQGYSAHGWKLGRNQGPRPGVVDACLARIDELRQRHGRKVSLIGWSLGGLYARELAKLRPDDIRMVVSLGSPFTGPRSASNASGYYDRLNSGSRTEHRSPLHLRQAPPVPTTSIYSQSDGIVAWQCSVQDPGPRTENIEVDASHIGMGSNPVVLRILANRLAQRENEWRPHAESWGSRPASGGRRNTATAALW